MPAAANLNDAPNRLHITVSDSATEAPMIAFAARVREELGERLHRWPPPTEAFGAFSLTPAGLGGSISPSSYAVAYFRRSRDARRDVAMS